MSGGSPAGESGGQSAAASGSSGPSADESDGRSAAAGDEDSTSDDERARPTRRWRGVTGIALFVGAVGVLTARPLVLLTGVVGAAFAAYSHLTGTPSPDLAIERSLDVESPDHGEEVTVYVRIRNRSGFLPDCRIVDGVPPMLEVVSGTPRHAAVLWPGRETTFSYAVRADYGIHQFDPATVIARDAAGAREVETTVGTDRPLDLECTDDVPEVPLREETSAHTGRLVTDRGGSGIEFFQTRTYRRGDPMRRIDWRRFAKTNELTTVEFREERTASVVLCIDADAGAYRARTDEAPNAVAYGVAGAEQLLNALAETRNFVGVAALGRELCWRKPGSGRDHEDALRETLAGHPTLSTDPPREGTDTWVDDDQRAELRRRLDADAQVLLFSPLADDEIVSTAAGLEADGTAVTVVSPDVTARESAGARLAAVERRHRIRQLRQSGVPVVDWDPEEPLGTELLRSQERMSA